MVRRLAGAGLLACVISGFCLPAHANTTALPGLPSGAQIAGWNDLALPPTPPVVLDQPAVRVALLLPLQSGPLRAAAEAVRAGFEAGYEREPHGVEVQLVETGDAAQDVLTGFNSASVTHDIVVGPLSRTGVTAVAQSGMSTRPTIALTAPDTSGDIALALPAQMLVMGLSLEEEAKQVATWAALRHPGSKALVAFTDVAWQRRAARAFEQQWHQMGRESEPVELVSNDGFVNARALLQLKMQMPSDARPVIFAALDARQARQVRGLMGQQFPLYGTSQLNPLPLSQPLPHDPMTDMEGVRLVDIPWQLQPDHDVVLAYPPLEAREGITPNADLQRLYALGIDAYRVARQIAQRQLQFEMDGVTGRLRIAMEAAGSRFDRTEQPAQYRGGAVVPLSGRD